MRRFLFITAALFVAPFLGTSFARADDDWQYWNEVTLKAKVADQWAASVKGEQWLREDMSELYLSNVSAGFLWMPSKYLEMGPYYRYEYTKTARGKHTQENRYYPELTLKLPYKRLVLSNRSRLEYRDRSTGTSWRYRDQFKLAASFYPGKHKVTPYLADEIFADTLTNRLSQNRLTAGFSTPVMKHVEIRFYYILKSDRLTTEWSQSHILGTGLDFSF